MKVYEEYHNFYANKNKRPANWNRKLTIKKFESITKPKPLADTYEDPADMEGEPTTLDVSSEFSGLSLEQKHGKKQKPQYFGGAPRWQ
mmetsp:Transcript_32970/g.50435  ORF Transcript_32970/g.50435 Transcript_32970/m.50435 type:complete len:88 (+) Transcript_32970:2180-2443(+)